MKLSCLSFPSAFILQQLILLPLQIIISAISLLCPSQLFPAWPTELVSFQPLALLLALAKL
jgi:hypothetical protein